MQVFGGQVYIHDLISLRHDFVGHAFLHAHASRLLDKIVKRLEVLDIDRCDHVDTSAQEILDVFISLAIRTVGRVGMSELINKSYGRLSGDDGVDVHLA